MASKSKPTSLATLAEAIARVAIAEIVRQAFEERRNWPRTAEAWEALERRALMMAKFQRQPYRGKLQDYATSCRYFARQIREAW